MNSYFAEMNDQQKKSEKTIQLLLVMLSAEGVACLFLSSVQQLKQHA